MQSSSNEFDFFGQESSKNRKRKKCQNTQWVGIGTHVLPEQQSSQMHRQVLEQEATPVLKDREDEEIQSFVMKHMKDRCRDHKTSFVEKGSFRDIFRYVNLKDFKFLKLIILLFYIYYI